MLNMLTARTKIYTSGDFLSEKLLCLIFFLKKGTSVRMLQTTVNDVSPKHLWDPS